MVLDINPNTAVLEPVRDSWRSARRPTSPRTTACTAQELWKSDGTAAGTVLVKDINPGSASSEPSNLTNVNGTLFFTADDGAHGIELWKSDGTAAGTVLVKDINPGSAGSDPPRLTNVNGTLFFSANDGTHGHGAVEERRHRRRHRRWSRTSTPAAPARTPAT